MDNKWINVEYAFPSANKTVMVVYTYEKNGKLVQSAPVEATYTGTDWDFDNKPLDYRVIAWMNVSTT